MKQKKFKMEYLIYLFLLLTPFFDAFSFIFRSYYPNSSISPTTILRPVIPVILLLYIFVKDQSSRKWIISGGVLYCLYGVFHLWAFHTLHTDFNAGGIFSEAQYVLNYTYMISLFYTLFWFYKKSGLKELQKYLSWMLVIYLGLIYVSIITGTSSTTYIDGIGYKGWNASGNGLSAIFILGFCSTFTYLLKYIKKWYVGCFLIALFYYLLILFGTRTAFFGSILVLAIYGFGKGIIYLFQRKEKIKIKSMVWIILVVLMVGSVAVASGANVLKRRQNMAKLGNEIVDPLTNTRSHLTGDLTNFVVEIKTSEPHVFMSDAQKRALLRTYQTASKYNLSNTNRRLQQLIYHNYLFEEQLSVKTLLLGNGYLNNYPELTLEMELPAFFYNFGLLGFVLYFGPFLSILIYMVMAFFKHIKTVTIDYMMYLAGAGLSVILSCLTGYVYFYVSSMLVVICIYILLIKESEEIK